MAVAAWTRDHKIGLAGVLVGAAGVVVAAVAAVVSVASSAGNSDDARPSVTVLTAPSLAPGKGATASSPAPVPTAGRPPTKPVEYSYYPSRRGYRCADDACTVAPRVTINSVVNNPTVGDERFFLAGSKGGGDVQNRLAVEPGDIVTVRAYINNDTNASRLGRAGSLAQNLSVRVLIPTAAQAFFNLVGFIQTDNGNPARLNDTMLLVGEQTLKLAYVPGSARYTHIVQDAQVSDPVSDQLVTSRGAGFGNLQPGLANAFFLTLQVRVAAG